jgi:hypothetical protein
MVDNDTTLSAKELAVYESWKQHAPNWQVFIWDRERLGHLVANKYPEIWALLSRMQIQGQIVDVARYLLTKELGGVYADMDVYMLDGSYLDSLLQCSPNANYSFMYTFEMIDATADTVARGKGRRQLANYFFATKPHGVTINRLLEESSKGGLARTMLNSTAPALPQQARRVALYGDAQSHQEVIETTGPLLVTDIVELERHNTFPEVLYVSGIGGLCCHPLTHQTTPSPRLSKSFTDWTSTNTLGTATAAPGFQA